MHHWFLPPLYGFLLTIIVMYPLRRLAAARHMEDSPGGRKQHEGRVPLVGGVAMFMGTAWGFQASVYISPEWSLFLLSATLMVLVGLMDDVFNLRASVRAATQLIALLLMTVGADKVIRVLGAPFFGDIVDTGALAIPFTLLVGLTVINAYNMMDGIDGLAAGVSVVAVGGMAVLAAFAGLYPETIYLYVLIACLMGFMVFNLPLGVNARLRTFMGDAGSMFLGLAIVWFGVALTQGERAAASPVALLWFAAMPVHDLIATIVCRLVKGQRPWAPGRDHVHHLLIDRGLSARGALVAIVLTQLVFVLVGLSGPLLGVSDGLLFTAWCLAGVCHLYFAHCSPMVAMIWAKSLKML